MCGDKGIRRMLVSFNVVFLVVSLGLIGIGSWIVSDVGAILTKYAPANVREDKLLIQDVGVAAISIGVISAVISFLGCCGAARDSRKMLFSFMIMMVVIFVSVLISAIVAVSRQELVKVVVRKTLEAESRGNTTIDNGLMALAHNRFNCCGIDDMPLCDRDYPPTGSCPANSPLCAKGCLGALWDNVFSPYMRVAAIILFVLSAIVLVGITFAAALFKAIGKGDYSYVRQD